MANMQPIIATEQPKKKKTKAKGPKKGSSAYIFFSVNKRAEIKASMPEKTTNQELLSEIGRKWKELTVEEKKPFDELALKDKARYQKEMNALPQSIN
uniref:HMG box domain-containing protein n=1 Tax=Proboscia inermis TaxID=420281 RepID=A0A7S0C1Y5_9STRA